MEKLKIMKQVKKFALVITLFLFISACDSSKEELIRCQLELNEVQVELGVVQRDLSLAYKVIDSLRQESILMAGMLIPGDTIPIFRKVELYHFKVWLEKKQAEKKLEEERIRKEYARVWEETNNYWEKINAKLEGASLSDDMILPWIIENNITKIKWQKINHEHVEQKLDSVQKKYDVIISQKRPKRP